MALNIIYCKFLHRRKHLLLLESMCGIRESLWEMTESEQFYNVFQIIIYGHIELRSLNSH